MQAIAPLSSVDFLVKGRKPLYKFELFYGVGWVDMTDFPGSGINYLKGISLSEGGAEMMPEPVAGSWSAVIKNPQGKFDPENTDENPYNEYFQAGRRVKILVGLTHNGTDYFWRRFYGFMREPKFSIKNSEISIDGYDSMEFLVHTKFKKPDNYWGTSATFSSVATANTYGAEIYAPDHDAMTIPPNEANAVAQWIGVDCTFASVADVGGGSVWVGHHTQDPGEGLSTVTQDSVGAVTIDTPYCFQFKYRRWTTSGRMTLGLYEQGTDNLMAEITYLQSESWTTVDIFFKATKSCNLKIKLTIVDYVSTGQFRVDQFSLREVTGQANEMYNLPDECTGIYFVTLDDEIVPYGVKDEGWRYDQIAKRLYFDGDKQVEVGTDNLIIYYFETQNIDNVVADILVKANLYDTRSQALADMIYTPTGITVDRVRFRAGKTAIEAIRLLCERCNYRFYFNYGNRPVFDSAPIAEAPGNEDFTFEEYQIDDINEYQNKSEIRNRIIIEGERDPFLEEREEAMSNEIIGEAFNQASINKHGEKTWMINNHLFQDQASIDSYVTTYLNTFKNPKWYADYPISFCSVPIEKGDTLKWQKKYGAETKKLQRGILRDIKMDDFVPTIVVEKVTYFPSNGDLIGYWPFDELSGMVAYDKSGQGNNGSLENMEEVDHVNGKVGKALDFDGANDYVNVPDDDSLDITDEITISAWIKAASVGLPTGAVIVGKRENTTTNYMFYLSNGWLIFAFYNGGWKANAVSKFKLDDDTWHHVVVTYDKVNYIYYVDEEADSKTETAAMVASVKDVRIGHFVGGDANRHFKGLIDEVRIYKRVLTEDEIKALYKGE